MYCTSNDEVEYPYNTSLNREPDPVEAEMDCNIFHVGTEYGVLLFFSKCNPILMQSEM